MRRRAFNIENLINYFNACGQEYNINVQQRNLMSQIRNTYYALIITLISTVIGAGLTIYSSDKLQIMIKKAENVIESKFDSVKSLITTPATKPKEQTDGNKGDNTAKQTSQTVEKKSK